MKTVRLAKFAKLVLASIVVTGLAYNLVHGQAGRPPQPPRSGPSWTCSRCGHSLGRGAAPSDLCPHCGARIINGVYQPGGDYKKGSGSGSSNLDLRSRIPPPLDDTPTTTPSTKTKPAPSPTAQADKDPPSSLPLVIGGIVAGSILLVGGLAMFKGRSGGR
ncbi:hypothetical protein AYO40_05430 [Planctomycetaceae bacterium SCGC AG-212-D15]|nr:hypothetical protein AYO40_05430 [Planctomycetaceae bacterium SCGC AG-212-D15]